jgi:hypothetical protein
MKELVVKLTWEKDHAFVGYFMREENSYFHLNGEPLLTPTELSKSADFLTCRYEFLSKLCPSLPLLVYLRSSDDVCFCLCSNAGKDDQSDNLILSVILLNEPTHDISSYQIVEFCYLVSKENFENDFSFLIVKKFDELINQRLPLGKLKNISMRLEKKFFPDSIKSNME